MRGRVEGPYVHVTWMTGLLAGDDQCWWRLWLQATREFRKRERSGGNLEQWKIDHAAMVETRAAELVAEGWTVRTEYQNKFRIMGRNGVTLAGVPDIVAIRGDRALVVDCKSGKRRDKDYWQVLVYVWLLPVYHKHVKGTGITTIVGEVRYPDGTRDLPVGSLTPEKIARITATLDRCAVSAPEPTRAPSGHECSFCCVGAWDCPDRVESDDALVETEAF